MPISGYLELLRNHIDISRVPFSDRGSRLLVFRYPYQNGLYVKLAERLIQLESDIEAYLHRPPFIQGLQFLDEEGQELEFEVTSYPHLLQLHTRLGDIQIVFQDIRTLSFGLPQANRLGMRFRVFPQFWKATPSGGKFMSVRNVSYSASCDMQDNRITPVEGGYEVEFYVCSEGDASIDISIHPYDHSASLLKPFPEAFASAEQRWQSWFDRVPPVLPQFQRTYAYAWWVMGNNLISPLGSVTYEAMAPSKLNYVGLWLWDNAMHTLAFRHVDAELARNQIRAMIAHQLPNGMLPDAVFDEGVVSSINHPIQGEVTKPPILAWAAVKLHEIDPDINFYARSTCPWCG